jgi:signal transduction histidine kinase
MDGNRNRERIVMSLNHQFGQRATPRLNPINKHRHRTRHHADRERVAVSTRTAHEIQNTLLQGLRPVSTQMQAAIGQSPDDSTVKPRCGIITALVTRVLEEGRRALQDLRLPPREDQDLSLAVAIAAIPSQLRLSPLIQFRVSVMGDCTILNPSHRENVYRVCRESIVNAYRHSGGDKVYAELTYRRSGLRITIRDNGHGIDCEELKRKRNNHNGLNGMRERANRMGARLSILSGIGLGTEVELFLPAAVSGSHPKAVADLENWL